MNTRIETFRRDGDHCDDPDHDHSGGRCSLVVQMITEYLEGALPDDKRERFERHLAACPPCVRFFDQLRAVSAIAPRLRCADVPPAVEERVLRFLQDKTA